MKSVLRHSTWCNNLPKLRAIMSSKEKWNILISWGSYQWMVAKIQGPSWAHLLSSTVNFSSSHFDLQLLRNRESSFAVLVTQLCCCFFFLFFFMLRGFFFLLWATKRRKNMLRSCGDLIQAVKRVFVVLWCLGRPECWGSHRASRGQTLQNKLHLERRCLTVRLKMFGMLQDADRAQDLAGLVIQCLECLLGRSWVHFCLLL